MKGLKYIILFFVITFTSLNVNAYNCTGVTAWTPNSGYSGGDIRTYGGIAYRNSAANGWDGSGVGHTPPTNGHWTPLGACSAEPAVTTTDPPTAVTSTSMTLRGNVTDQGGSAVLERGFIYGTNYTDVDNSSSTSLQGSSLNVTQTGTTGAYTKGISSLCPAQIYYYKAYAKNSTDEGYGNVEDHTTSSPGTFTTTQAGAFSSAATWGGCSPPSLTINHTINIGHAVTSSGLTITEGTDLVVTSGGNLTNTGTITLGGTGSIATVTVDAGGTITTTNVGYTSAGVVTNNGTFNITGELDISSVGTFNTSGTATITNIDNNNGDFNQTAGTVTVSGWYDCSNDCDFDQSGGAMTVSGNFKVWGSGESHMDGTLDVGTVIMDNNGYMDGTGVLTYTSSNVNANNSGAYIACVGNIKYDDNVLSAWSSLPASAWDLNTCTTLPIELLSFEVKLVKDLVLIEWVTGSEINNDYFEVQASRDGIEWETIKIVQGAGNSFDVIHYSSYDMLIDGYDIKYYRLTQFDFDGKNETSQIRMVNFNSETFFDVNSNNTDIIIKTSFDKETIVNIHNINGKVIRTKVMRGDNVTYVPTYGLSGSLYFVSAIVDGFLYSEKILVR